MDGNVQHGVPSVARIAYTLPSSEPKITANVGPGAHATGGLGIVAIAGDERMLSPTGWLHFSVPVAAVNAYMLDSSSEPTNTRSSPATLAMAGDDTTEPGIGVSAVPCSYPTA